MAKPAYGVALNTAELAQHETYLQILDGLHDRITALEHRGAHLDIANRIYAGIATASTIVSFLAAGIALSMWTSQ